MSKMGEELDRKLSDHKYEMWEALQALLNASICDICYEDNCGDEFSCTKGVDAEPCECHQTIREADSLGHKVLAKIEGE